MNYSFNIPMEVTKRSSFLFDKERDFMTSLNIIGEVMNVPMCALSSILRANGYEEVAPDSICIDEKMLSYFADAYIRKMKNYFLSSIRNYENLTYQEFTDLNEFYNTFKKIGVKLTRKAEWSHIDTGLLRNAFMDNIKELTPRRKSRLEYLCEFIAETCDCSLPLFSVELNGYEIAQSEYSPCESILYCIINSRTNERNVLMRITRSRFYQIKYKQRKFCFNTFNIMRQFFIAARYHIFAADDTDSDGEKSTIVNKPSLFIKLISNKYEQRTSFKKYRHKQSFRRRQVGSQTVSEAKSLRRVYQAHN